MCSTVCHAKSSMCFHIATVVGNGGQPICQLTCCGVLLASFQQRGNVNRRTGGIRDSSGHPQHGHGQNISGRGLSVDRHSRNCKCRDLLDATGATSSYKQSLTNQSYRFRRRVRGHGDRDKMGRSLPLRGDVQAASVRLLLCMTIGLEARVLIRRQRFAAVDAHAAQSARMFVHAATAIP